MLNFKEGGTEGEVARARTWAELDEETEISTLVIWDNPLFSEENEGLNA